MMRPIVLIVEAHSMNKLLIAVVGPTGIGKTALAIAIAKHYETEIVSADSRQFYKEMKIGTAVPSSEELQEVPHHFIQQISIDQDYSVGDYEREAIVLLKSLFKKNSVVVLAGGSGLYVDAVVSGLDRFPEVDGTIRKELNYTLKQEGLQVMQERLQLLDPEYYQKVDLENPHRVIRALEVCIASGLPYSSFLNRKKTERFFKTLTVGIQAEREIVYSRINQRVDNMIEEGLLAEAKKLYPKKYLNALQTVGYREIFAYLEGKFELAFAISEIKKNTRRFAKRQLTWYRKREDILWVSHDLPAKKAIEKIQEYLTADHNA